MVNVQFGKIGGKTEQGGGDDMDEECMVIGVFEKRKVDLHYEDEKDDGDLDLTLDLLGDDNEHKEEGKIWPKKEENDHEENIEEIGDTGNGNKPVLEGGDRKSRKCLGFLEHLLSKKIADISSRVIAEQGKAKMNQEANTNLVEELKKKNDELISISGELKKTRETLFEAKEMLETKANSGWDKEEELLASKNLLENKTKLLETSAREASTAKEALEAKSQVLKNVKKELSATKKVLESKEVFETKLKSMTAELSSTQSAYEKKSASLKEKDDDLARTKKDLEKLLKTMEEKSIAMRSNENELSAVRESLDEKEKELKDNISMQEEKAGQMMKFVVDVRKLTEEKTRLEDEHFDCNEKMKISDKKILELESLSAKNSIMIETLKKELEKKGEKVESQRGEHKREVRKLEEKQKKDLKKLKEKQEEEREKWLQKNKDLTKVLFPHVKKAQQRDEVLASSGDPEATSSSAVNSFKTTKDEKFALKAEVEKLKEKLKLAENGQNTNKMRNEKLSVLSENLKGDVERISLQEKGVVAERDRETKDNILLKSKLEKLEIEVKEFSRANEALKEKLRSKREELAKMSSFKKRPGSPSSREPPRKRHEAMDSARLNPAEQPRQTTGPSENPYHRFPQKDQQHLSSRDPRIRRMPIVNDGSNTSMI